MPLEPARLAGCGCFRGSSRDRCIASRPYLAHMRRPSMARLPKEYALLRRGWRHFHFIAFKDPERTPPWLSPGAAGSAAYFPGSTIGEGRNLMYLLAREQEIAQGWLYDYVRSRGLQLSSAGLQLSSARACYHQSAFCVPLALVFAPLVCVHYVQPSVQPTCSRVRQVVLLDDDLEFEVYDAKQLRPGGDASRRELGVLDYARAQAQRGVSVRWKEVPGMTCPPWCPHLPPNGPVPSLLLSLT